MSSQSVNIQTAETRFRQAFERLKVGMPKILPQGAPVTQNNIAREAGCDPTALRKARYPALIREIQAYIELHKNDDLSIVQKARKRRAKRSIEDRLKSMTQQRDNAQSILASANMRILELTEQVQLLQQQLDEHLPRPITFTNAK
jgi:hypothetical protein